MALGGPIGGVVVGLSDYPAIFYVMVAAALASAALGALPLQTPDSARPEPSPATSPVAEEEPAG